MALWQVYGPDEAMLGMADVQKLLGGVSEATVRAMIAEERFPAPIQAGPKSPPFWTGLTIACWQHVSPMMQRHLDEPPARKGG